VTDDIRKLLAGYATGTLSEAERKSLFEAALSDEELFAAISDEEPLRELLSDAAARRELLSRIEPAPRAFRERFATWLRRPVIAGGLATAALAVVVVSIVPLLRMQPPPAEYAQVRVPARAVAPAPPGPEPAAETMATAPAAKPRRAERKSQPVAPGPEAAATAEAPAAVPATPPAPLQEAPAAAAPGNAPVVAENLESRFDVRTERAAGQLVATKAAARQPLQARLAVLKRSAAGDYVKVDPATTVFSGGDMVRIRVEPGESGFVHVVSSALGQPIVGIAGPARAFETADIRIGDHDMRLNVRFTTDMSPVQGLVASMRASDAARPQPGAIEIILHVKKP
jgi:cytoskeletal protein RodZ